MIGLLLKSLYGTRSAVKKWQLQLAQGLTGMGFIQAQGPPRLFRHLEFGAGVAVNGDDIWVLEEDQTLGAVRPSSTRRIP